MSHTTRLTPFTSLMMPRAGCPLVYQPRGAAGVTCQRLFFEQLSLPALVVDGRPYRTDLRRCELGQIDTFDRGLVLFRARRTAKDR